MEQFQGDPRHNDVVEDLVGVFFMKNPVFS